VLRNRLTRVPAWACLLVLVLGTLAAAGGAAMALRRTRTYASTASLFIDEPVAAAQRKSGASLAKLLQLKSAYADLASSTPVAGQAAQELGLSEREVADAVNATAPSSSGFLVLVTANAATPGLAQQIADADARAMTAYAAGELGRHGIPPEDRLQLAVARTAGPGVLVQPTRKVSFQAAFGYGVLGLLAALAILELAFARPPTNVERAAPTAPRIVGP
jgi:capsular polysaccharide biosynthesis protein